MTARPITARHRPTPCKPWATAYTSPVPETTGNEIGVSKDSVADDRHMAVFSRPYAKCLQWSGLGEGAFAHAGSHGRRYANLAMCPASRLASGVGFLNLSVEAPMPKVFARPEQSRFPLAVSAGRHAADLWLQSPPMSLCDWRDNRFAAHACGMGFTELAERRLAFNEAFAHGIAGAIVGVVFVAVEVCHA